MKLLTIIFIFVAWTVVKGAIQSDISGTPIVTFPTFDPPEFDFRDLSGGCGGFADCIEYVGAVLYNLGQIIRVPIEFLIEVLQYIVEFIQLVVEIQFTGIDGAPTIINVLLTVPFFAAIALIIFNAIRRGKTASD